MSPPKRTRRQGHQGSLNAFVYCLIVLAVVLGGIAGWTRYSSQPQSEPGDTIERQVDAYLPSFGVGEGWTQAGGPPRNMAMAPMCRFICPQCQSHCWTRAGRGCPACPFCGLAMVEQGRNQPGVKLSLVGAADRGAATLPIAIQADAVRPHADRGACTNCHTVLKRTAPVLVRPHGDRGACANCHAAVRSSVSSFGQMPTRAGQSNPKTLWQGVAAPAIPADAVRPTLIREFGIEVCPAPGGVKVTGVMGNSYASNAGLAAGDIIIKCNGANVRNLGQFLQLVSRAAPETDAQLTVMRNGQTRDLLVMVGEGEMEGFIPIQPP